MKVEKRHVSRRLIEPEQGMGILNRSATTDIAFSGKLIPDNTSDCMLSRELLTSISQETFFTGLEL